VTSSSNPRITVIVCNYNYDQYVVQAINSVLEQTFGDFELVVIDDGSTDKSREAIESIRDSRIRNVFQKNGGQACAFNFGFSMANGEIITFLDSDDWWKPEKLSTIIRWHEFLEGQYGVLQHALEIWQDGNTHPYKRVLPVGDCFGEMQETGRIDFFVPTSGLCFRKRLLEKVFPIPEQFIICADAFLMRAAFVHGQVYSIPQPLGYYRKHDNTVFGNQEFNINKFLHEQLFPELNQYYLRMGLDFRYDVNRKENNHGRKGRFAFLKRLIARLDKEN